MPQGAAVSEYIIENQAKVLHPGEGAGVPAPPGPPPSVPLLSEWLLDLAATFKLGTLPIPHTQVTLP